MDIKAASRADLESIVLLHKETFKGYFSGELSAPCLTAFYQALIDSPLGRAFVLYEENNKFAGFIAGCASRAYVSFALEIRMVAEMLKMCRFLELVRTFKKAVYYRRLGIQAELIAVSVKPEFQRRGVGNLLLGALEKYFVDAAVARYFVLTDIEHASAMRFYQTHHFTEFKRMDLFGLEAVVFQKLLPA
jgi:ribosomal protein S18 acetylase RimI-like enzyme